MQLKRIIGKIMNRNYLNRIIFFIKLLSSIIYYYLHERFYSMYSERSHKAC